jgi:hypothetical protein
VEGPILLLQREEEVLPLRSGGRLFAGTLSVVDANRFRHRAQVRGCTLAQRTGSRTLRRLARGDLPKESIRDFLRSVEGQKKQAMREITQQLVSPSAMPALLSQACTSAHVSLIKPVGPPRATPLT